MTTVKLDKEFETSKKGLVRDGIRALSLKLGRDDITQDNLGLFLYTKDPAIISKDYSHPWQEFLEDDVEEEEALKSLKYSKMKTMAWLTNGGYKIFNKRFPDIEICNYIWNFQYFWSTYFTEVGNSRDADYYRPSLLQWALYLTIREPIPKGFPLDGMFTYALSRWTDIRNAVIRDVNWNSPKAQEYAVKCLKKRLHELCIEAETFIAREDGTYEELKKQRLIRRYGYKIPKELYKEIISLTKKGFSPSEIYEEMKNDT